MVVLIVIEDKRSNIVLAYIYNGARARHLPNSALLLLYSITPIISSLTTSALAALPIYLFTTVLATPSLPFP